MTKTRLFFLLLFALLVAARLCHLETLWAEETLPLAAAQEMRAGKVLYRDIWFDKPPLAPVLYAALGGEAVWRLRLAGALYALLNNFVDPRSLYWTQSGNFVIMAVLGGMRSFWGPLSGAAIYVVLQDYLSSQTVNWMSFIGMIFVLVVLFFPRGVLGMIRRKVMS